MRSLLAAAAVLIAGFGPASIPAGAAGNPFAGHYQGVALGTSGPDAPEILTLTWSITSSGSMTIAVDNLTEGDTNRYTGSVTDAGHFNVNDGQGDDVTGTITENDTNHVFTLSYSGGGDVGVVKGGLLPADTSLAGKYIGAYRYSNGAAGTVNVDVTSAGAATGYFSVGNRSFAGYIDSSSNMYIAYYSTSSAPTISFGHVGENAGMLVADLTDLPDSHTLTLTLPLPIPQPPSDLKATASSSKVTLTWSASAGAAKYSVYRGTKSGEEAVAPIATGVEKTSYTNTGLTNGVTYYYKVKAVNSSGTSKASSEVSAKPS